MVNVWERDLRTSHRVVIDLMTTAHASQYVYASAQGRKKIIISVVLVVVVLILRTIEYNSRSGKVQSAITHDYPLYLNQALWEAMVAAAPGISRIMDYSN